MHIIIWHYTVRDSNRTEFESIYNSEGAWANLFAKAEGFLGTELLASHDRPGEYVTIDRWQSRDSFDRFQEQFADVYAALDNECDRLTDSETLLGLFDSSE